MTPRPKKATDEEVMAAVHRVISRLGPSEVTLADIASEAGVTAGALVQRFGSKRDLLLAFMEAAAAAGEGMFTGLRAGSPSPLDAVRAYGDCMAAMGDSPAALAHHLGYLQLDLTDPDFHRHARAQAEGARRALHGFLDDAVAAGELEPDTDTADLARAVEVTVSGSLMTWAFYQDGPARDWVRADLERLLTHHRP